MKLCNWEQFKRSGKYSLYKILEERLTHYHRLGNVTPGLQSSLRRKLFLRQLVDSIRRVDYAVRLSEGRFSADVADPLCLAFHPLKAAIYHHQKDDFDEACWLVFLFTHFGKNSKTNWRILRDVYSGFPDGPLWTWSRITASFESFQEWMRDFYQLANEDGIKRYFGNHRKYESIDPNKRTSTIFVFNSYISWIGGDHLSFFQSACKTGLINPSQGLFDCLFHKMSSVLRFGRMARFDYLTMLGKLGLLDVEPQRAYLEGSSGPVNGARLIYGNDPVLSVQDLEDKLAELAVVLQLGAYNMQILEDAICNWQKNPERYMHFRG